MEMIKGRKGLALESGEEGDRVHLGCENVVSSVRLGSREKSTKKQEQMIANVLLCFVFQMEVLAPNGEHY